MIEVGVEDGNSGCSWLKTGFWRDLEVGIVTAWMRKCRRLWEFSAKLLFLSQREARTSRLKTSTHTFTNMQGVLDYDWLVFGVHDCLWNIMNDFISFVAQLKLVARHVGIFLDLN